MKQRQSVLSGAIISSFLLVGFLGAGMAAAQNVRKDVAFGINISGGEREGQASESATIGGV